MDALLKAKMIEFFDQHREQLRQQYLQKLEVYKEARAECLEALKAWKDFDKEPVTDTGFFALQKITSQPMDSRGRPSSSSHQVAPRTPSPPSYVSDLPTFKLFVDYGERTLSFDVLDSDLIYGIKVKISNREGIAVETQHLVYKNETMDDRLPLHWYGINQTQTVTLAIGHKIIIRKVSGEPLEMVTHHFQKVEEIKAKVAHLVGLDVSSIWFLFKDEMMMNTLMMSEYDIQDGSEIQMVLSRG
jgi:hypothetical protein